jgi:hypothetical protein
VRIVADENVADAVVNAARSAGHELELVRDTYGTGTNDTAIESRASEDDRAVLTHDDDFLGLDAPHAPILFMPEDSPSVARVVGAVNRLEDYGIDLADGEFFVPDGWA